MVSMLGSKWKHSPNHTLHRRCLFTYCYIMEFSGLALGYEQTVIHTYNGKWLEDGVCMSSYVRLPTNTNEPPLSHMPRNRKICIIDLMANCRSGVIRIRFETLIRIHQTLHNIYICVDNHSTQSHSILLTNTHSRGKPMMKRKTF